MVITPFDPFLIALTDHCLSQIDYYDWAKANNFSSMLPKDAKNRRDEVTAESQSRIDPHLKEKPVKERVIPYSDDRFRAAAVEWLVSTDQVSDLDYNASLMRY